MRRASNDVLAPRPNGELSPKERVDHDTALIDGLDASNASAVARKPSQDALNLDLVKGGLSARSSAADDDDEAEQLGVKAEVAKKGNFWKIHPENSYKETWDWIVILFVVYNCIWVPIAVVLPNAEISQAQEMADFAIDGAFWIDIFLALITGFERMERGRPRLIMDRTLIRQEYFKFPGSNGGKNSKLGWFWIDIVATFPFDQLPGLNGLSFTGLFKLPRLARLGKMMKKLDKMKDASGIKLLVAVAQFLLIAHLTACVWIMLGTWSENKKAPCLYEGGCSWPEKNKVENDTGTMYLNGLYFAMSSLLKTPSFVPYTIWERLFLIFEQMLGVVVFSQLLGTVNAIMSEKAAAGKAFAVAMDLVNNVIVAHDVPDDLGHRMIGYAEHNLDMKYKDMNKVPVLMGMPQFLQEDVLLEQMNEIFETLPLFRRVSKNPSLQKWLVSRLKWKPNIPGDLVTIEGVPCKSIFCVVDGGKFERIDGNVPPRVMAVWRDWDTFGMCDCNIRLANESESTDLLEITPAVLQEMDAAFPDEISWKSLSKSAPITASVYLEMGKQLKEVKAGGCDAFVEVSCCEEKCTTRPHYRTLNPAFEEEFKFTIPADGYRMKVKVVKATGLAAADMTGTSDPFVELELGSQPRQKTAVVNRNCNPVWDEDFKFNVKGGWERALVLNVFDQDTLTDNDFIGRCVVDIRQFVGKGETELTMDLKDRGNGLDMCDVTGSLTIKVDVLDNEVHPYVDRHIFMDVYDRTDSLGMNKTFIGRVAIALDGDTIPKGDKKGVDKEWELKPREGGEKSDLAPSGHLKAKVSVKDTFSNTSANMGKGTEGSYMKEMVDKSMKVAPLALKSLLYNLKGEMGFLPNIPIILEDDEVDGLSQRSVRADTGREARTGAIDERSPAFVFLPSNVFKGRWDWFVLIFVAYVCFFVPFELAYNPPEMGWKVVVDWFVDIIFIVDIAFTFITAVEVHVGRKKMVITDRKTIRQMYMKPTGWFWLDFVASFPFELIFPLVGITNINPTALGLFKMPRLFRLSRLMKKLAKMKQGPGLTGVKLLVQTIVMSHVVGALMFVVGKDIIATNRLGELSWSQKRGMEISLGPPVSWDSALHSFSVCLFWAISAILKTPFIKPGTNSERVFWCIMLVVGIMLLVTIISQVMTVIGQLTAKSKALKDKQTAVRVFCTKNKLPETLSDAILDNAEYAHAVASKRPQPCVGSLPRDIQLQLSMHRHWKLIQKCGMFSPFNPETGRSLPKAAFSNNDLDSNEDIFVELHQTVPQAALDRAGGHIPGAMMGPHYRVNLKGQSFQVNWLRGPTDSGSGGMLDHTPQDAPLKLADVQGMVRGVVRLSNGAEFENPSFNPRNNVFTGTSNKQYTGTKDMKKLMLPKPPEGQIDFHRCGRDCLPFVREFLHSLEFRICLEGDRVLRRNPNSSQLTKTDDIFIVPELGCMELTARNGATLKIYRQYDCFGMQDASVRAAKTQDMMCVPAAKFRAMEGKFKPQCDQVRAYVLLNNGDTIVDKSSFVKPPAVKRRAMTTGAGAAAPEALFQGKTDATAKTSRSQPVEIVEDFGEIKLRFLDSLHVVKWTNQDDDPPLADKLTVSECDPAVGGKVKLSNGVEFENFVAELTNRTNLRNRTTDEKVIAAINHVRKKNAPLWAYEKEAHADAVITYSRAVVKYMKDQKSMIIPDCTWKELWDWFIILWVFYNAFYIPVDIAFAPDQTNAHKTIDFVCDTCFAIDMVLSFRTGFYVVKPGMTQVLVMGPIKVRKNYLKTWFWIDFAATFPFELVCYAIGMDVSLSFLGLLKLPRLMRLGRLMKKLSKSKNALAVDLFSILFGFLLFAHIFACAYTMIGELQRGTDTDEKMWLNHYKVSESVMTGYYTAMFWSLSSFLKTPSLPPSTTLEFFFVSFEQLISIMSLAYIMGKVTAVLNAASATSKQFLDKMKNVNKLADFNKIDEDTKEDMVKFVEHTMMTGARSFNNPTLSALPVYIKEDITTFQLRDVIENCKMWDALRGAENTIFKNMLHITLSYIPQLTGACVIDLGMHCPHIYILPEPGFLKVTDNRVEGKPAGKDGKLALGNHICTLHQYSLFGLFNEPEGTEQNADYPSVPPIRVDCEEECDLVIFKGPDIKTFSDRFPNEMTVLKANVRRSTYDIKVAHDDAGRAEEKGQTFIGEAVIGDGPFTFPVDPTGKYFSLITPESLKKEIWDWIVILFVFYNSFYIPFAIAFEPDYPMGQAVFDYFVDICFAIDIFLSFNTGYVDASDFKPERVMDAGRIRSNYFWGWFMIDFPATFPFELFFLMLGIKVDLQVLGLLKMPRLLRLSKLMKKLNKFKNADLVQLFVIFFGLVFIVHLTGCLMFIVGKMPDNVMSPEGDYWIKHYRIPDTVMDKYLASAYGAIASLLKMPVLRPHTDIEAGFFCALLLFGIFVLAGCVGKLVGVIVAMKAPKAAYQGKLKDGNEFIFKNHLSYDLGERIRQYIDYQTALFNKRVMKNPVGATFPLEVKLKIATQQFTQMSANTPVLMKFEGEGRDPRLAFRRRMCVEFAFKVCLHNDMIMFRYQPSDDLWLVPELGCLDLLGDTDFDVAHSFKEFSCVGLSREACAASEGGARTKADGYYSIRNRGSSDLILLNKGSQGVMAAAFPALWAEFKGFILGNLRNKKYSKLCGEISSNYDCEILT